MNSKTIETIRLKLRNPIEEDVILVLDFITRNKSFFEKWDPIRGSKYFTRENHKSLKLVENLGFRREGLAKKLLKINRKWEDHYRYALIIDG